MNPRRWWSRKTLSSPPLKRHTKITTTYRATLIYENELKTSRKDFTQLKR